MSLSAWWPRSRRGIRPSLPMRRSSRPDWRRAMRWQARRSHAARLAGACAPFRATLDLRHVHEASSGRRGETARRRSVEREHANGAAHHGNPSRVGRALPGARSRRGWPSVVWRRARHRTRRKKPQPGSAVEVRILVGRRQSHYRRYSLPYNGFCL